MSTLAEMVVRIGADASRLKRGLGAAAADVNRFQKRTQTAGIAIQNAGKQSMKGGLVVAAGLGFAIKTGMKFDKTMSTVRAATQANQKDFDKLRKSALKWGATTQFSATKVAEAMVEMGKAGFNTQQTLKAMPGVLAAAAASGESMATVSAIMVDTLTGFGMAAGQATKIADALAYSANATTSSIGDFGEALKYVAPVAKAAGVSFDETNGALIALAKVGIKGSMAGTSLRSTLLSMQAPNKRIAKQMKDMGLSFRDAQGNMKPFASNIDTLKTALSKMSKSEADTFLARAFGKENSAAMAAFLDIGGAGLRKFADDSRRSAGSAKKFADILRDNLAGDLENMGGAAETAAIHLSDDLTPAIKGVVKEATKLITAYNTLDPATRKASSQLIAGAAVFLTVAGAVGIVGGAVIRGVGIMSKAFTPLVAVLKWLGPKFKFALFAIKYFVQTSGGLLASLGRIGSIVFSPMGAALRLLASGFMWVAGIIAAAVTAIAAVLSIPVWVVAAIVAAVVAAAVLIVVKWDWIKAKTVEAWGAITGAISAAGGAIADAVRWCVAQVGALWDKLTSLTVKKVAYAFGFAVGYALGTLVKLVVQGAMHLARFVAAMGRAAQQAVTSFGRWLAALPGRIGSALSAAVSAAGTFIGDMASALGNAAQAGVQAFVGMAQALPGQAASIFRSVVSNVGSALAALPGKVSSAIKAAGAAIANAAEAMYEAALAVGAAIVNGIVAGIKAGAGAIRDAAVGAAKGALDGAKSALGIKSPSREAAKQVGLPFSEGIAAGIMAGGDGAAQAAATVAQNAVNRAQAVMDAVGRRQALTAAKKTKGKGDDRDALLAIKMAKLQARADRAQAAVDRLTGSVQKFSTAESLASAGYSLAVTLGGGQATLAQQQGRIAELTGQYTKLASFLKKNAKKLSADARAGILSQLQGLAGEMNDIQEAIADAARERVAGALSAVSSTNALADAQYNLQVALNGGTASMAQMQGRLGTLANEYAAVQNALNSNTLDIDQQTGLLNDLAGIANEMNQVRADIKEATSGGTTGTSGSTGTTDGGSSVTQAYVGKDKVARVVVHQNFIGPNVDHFTASRDALFSYQTAGLQT